MIKSRKSVRSLDAYSPPLEGRRGKTRLDFNENTSGPPEGINGLPGELVGTYPEYAALVNALAEYSRVPAERVMPVNGSGEGLFVSAFTFIEPGRERAVTSDPTFALIPHCLELVGADLEQVQVDLNLDFDVDAIEAALEKGAKMAVFATPDNPTGATLERGTVANWCEKFPRTLFVIDEAYGEYAGGTLTPLTLERDNLLVMKTFSKAWGMAGLRLGFMTGHPDLLGEMLKVRAPYSVNSAAARLAIEALPRASEVFFAAAKTMEEKKKTVARVKDAGYAVSDGAANFYLVGFGIDAGEFCNFSARRGVLVRDRSHMRALKGLVRVTAGTPDENESFIEILDRFRDTRALVFDMDDTLVDTSESYDATIMKLVEQYSGEPLSREDLLALRAEGGFNDDWDATVGLLDRRGITAKREEVMQKGREIYFSFARDVEKLLVDPDLLKALGRRYRLFVWTGRPRDEYEPVWGSVIDPLFIDVYCRDDFDGLPPKPSPMQLLEVMKKNKIEGGIYVGNSVDDMTAAREAGLAPVGVRTTLDDASLREAGALLTIPNMAELEKVFRL